MIRLLFLALLLASSPAFAVPKTFFFGCQQGTYGTQATGTVTIGSGCHNAVIFLWAGGGAGVAGNTTRGGNGAASGDFIQIGTPGIRSGSLPVSPRQILYLTINATATCLSTITACPDGATVTSGGSTIAYAYAASGEPAPTAPVCNTARFPSITCILVTGKLGALGGVGILGGVGGSSSQSYQGLYRTGGSNASGGAGGTGGGGCCGPAGLGAGAGVGPTATTANAASNGGNGGQGAYGTGQLNTGGVVGTPNGSNALTGLGGGGQGGYSGNGSAQPATGGNGGNGSQLYEFIWSNVWLGGGGGGGGGGSGTATGGNGGTGALCGGGGGGGGRGGTTGGTSGAGGGGCAGLAYF